MKWKAYSVFLLFRFWFSLLFSMATVLSLVYHLEIVGLNPFQLVVVGTVLETACFLLEIPTGIVADIYSRRHSVLIGLVLYGAGFVLEGAVPRFGAVLAAQVIWGCGDTFISGALEAWIGSEERTRPMEQVFLRGSQLSQAGSMVGMVLGTLLGSWSLQLPLVMAGLGCVVLAFALFWIMPETNFLPVPRQGKTLLLDMTGLFRINLCFLRKAPVLLALLAVVFCGGLGSEGFDRLSTAHFLEDSCLPSFWGWDRVTWFGLMGLLGSGLGILASQVLLVYLEKRGQSSRTGVVIATTVGYAVGLLLFALGRNFWFMLIFYLLTGSMRTLKEPILSAWMNEHIREDMRATVFSTSGQLDALGQIIGGPLVGLVAQYASVSWGLAVTALLLLPAWFLIPLAAKAETKRICRSDTI